MAQSRTVFPGFGIAAFDALKAFGPSTRSEPSACAVRDGQSGLESAGVREYN